MYRAEWLSLPYERMRNAERGHSEAVAGRAGMQGAVPRFSESEVPAAVCMRSRQQHGDLCCSEEV